MLFHQHELAEVNIKILLSCSWKQVTYVKKDVPIGTLTTAYYSLCVSYFNEYHVVQQFENKQIFEISRKQILQNCILTSERSTQILIFVARNYFAHNVCLGEGIQRNFVLVTMGPI